MFGIELAIQLFAQGDQLLALEVADRHTLPGLACALDGSVHQLEHGPFAECMWNRFGAAALF